MFRIDPADPRPLWRQIEEGIRDQVASGRLAPATALPSVRDLARDLRLNPATVSRAYQRLTEAGVLAVRRGEGTFVAASPPQFDPLERERKLGEAARRYAAHATTLGASREDAASALATAWNSLARDPARSEATPQGGESR